MRRLGGWIDAADARNLGLLLLAVVLLWIPRLQGPIDLRWDAGVYYVLGTSLAEGRGYRLLNEPGEIEAVQYPPVLPVAVALVQTAMGTNDSVRVGQALRYAFFALALAYSAATYVLARQLLPPLLSLLAGSLVSLHHHAVFLSDLCNTEIPYALLSVLFVIALRAGREVGAGALAVAAFLLRSAGIALLGAWVGEALLRRRWRAAALRGLVALAPLLLWQAYVREVTHGTEYRAPAYTYQRAPYQQYNVTYAENLRLLDPFRPELGALTATELVRRVAHNAIRLPLRLGDAVSATAESWTYSVWRLGLTRWGWGAPVVMTRLLRAALGLGVALGLLWLGRRREWAMVLYVLGSLALVVVTPWPLELPRYLAPLAPFLALAFAGAVAWAWSARSRVGPAPGLAGMVLLAVALLSQALALGVLYYYELQPAEFRDRSGTRATGRLFYHGPAARAVDDAMDWLAVQAAPGAVLATTLPHSAFLRTGRRAVLPPREADPVEAQHLLDSVPIAFLVVDNANRVEVSRRYGAPAVEAHPDLWELVYDRGVGVYHRRALEGTR